MYLCTVNRSLKVCLDWESLSRFSRLCEELPGFHFDYVGSIALGLKVYSIYHLIQATTVGKTAPFTSLADKVWY